MFRVCLVIRARNWPRLIVRNDQKSGKDELSFTGFVPTGQVPLLHSHVKQAQAWQIRYPMSKYDDPARYHCSWLIKDNMFVVLFLIQTAN